MGIFQRQIDFIDSLEGQIYKSLESVINGQGMTLEEAITDDQMYERGVDGTDQPIKDQKTGRLGYTRTTIKIKIAKGQPVDRITLRDENDFHPSVTIRAFSDRFEVSSNVTHAKWLIKRYGGNILRPTLGNMTEFFNNYFLPSLKTTINDRFTK